MTQWVAKNRLFIVLGFIVAFVLASALGATYGRAALNEARENKGLEHIQPAAGQKPEAVELKQGEQVATPATRANLPLALQIQPEDMVYGSDDAPVQIVEYASLTCHHCATFHNEVWPELRQTLVQEGKVQFVFRFLPWDNLSFAVSKIVACGEGEQKDVLLSAFFKTQEQWIRSENQLESVQQIARMGGMMPEDVDACLKSEDIHQSLTAMKDTAMQDLNVRATPTLFVNGERLEGVRRLPEIKAVVESVE